MPRKGLSTAVQKSASLMGTWEESFGDGDFLCHLLHTETNLVKYLFILDWILITASMLRKY
jgi:hypothetical protein